MKRQYITDHEIAVVRELYPNGNTAEIAELLGVTIRRVHSIASGSGIKKTVEFKRKQLSDAGKESARINVSQRFRPGHVPWNKGIPHSARDRAIETQFKPGHVPHQWRPIGTERVCDGGYLQRKLTDTGVTRRDYVPVHHIVWREAGREIPKGHALIFRDGNNRNFSLDNLELITRAELMRRNSFHQFGPEISALTQLRGAITRQINKRTRNEQTV